MSVVGLLGGLGALVAAPAAAAAPAVGSATAEAVASARADGLRVAVAVTDTTTGATTVAGEAAALFPSESVVKVLIASRLLVDGQLTGAVETAAARMLTASDDQAANSLWGLVGGADVIGWAAERYGLSGLGEPSEWGGWGNTKVSATGLAALYTALADDPVVAPWLVTQLSAMTGTAADGTDQTFGFAAADAGDTALKQGWGGDDDSESTANLLSTGYVDDERYAVAAIVQDPSGGSTTALVPTIDALAAAVLADTSAPAVTPSATATATDEVMATAAPATSGLVGGASGPVENQAPWWPASVAVLGTAMLLGAATLTVSVWQRRRATARPS